MKIFGKRKPAPELVTTGRFELERDGHVATLQYTIAGNVLALLHSEIPESLRRRHSLNLGTDRARLGPSQSHEG
jgi:hypothetical protein